MNYLSNEYLRGQELLERLLGNEVGRGSAQDTANNANQDIYFSSLIDAGELTLAEGL